MPVTARNRPAPPPREAAIHIHLLGLVDYEDCLSLQRRLAYDALTRADGRIVVLICEHPPLVTIGRGGGAILHAPGQLAIYPIVPLEWHGWTVGQHLRQLQAALAELLIEFKVKPAPVAGSFALAGQGGVLAALGVAVRGGVSLHGAFLNVNPELRDFGRVEVAPGRTMTSLLSHRALATKMTRVRAALVSHLAEALGLERYHLHTGHPLLAELPAAKHTRDSAA